MINIEYKLPILGRIKELKSNLLYLNKAKDSIEIKAEFITPISILPIVSIWHDKNLGTITSSSKKEINSYLRNINFPNGVSDLDGFANSTYL